MIRTDQAAVFGFPNPLIGLVAYAVVIVVAVAVRWPVPASAAGSGGA